MSTNEETYNPPTQGETVLGTSSPFFTKGWSFVAYWVCLLLPLSVFLLPRFTTALEEDLLLGIAAFIILIRFFSPRPFTVTPSRRCGEFLFAVIVLYSLGWTGFYRGYAADHPVFVLLYPVILLAAFWLRPESERDVSRRVQWVETGILVSLILITLSSLVLLAAGGSFATFSSVTIMGLLLIGLIGIVMLAVPPDLDFLPSRVRWLPELLLLIAASMVGMQDFQIWNLWRIAGAEERAWAPFQYEDPNQIQYAADAPRRAFDRYSELNHTLLGKGRLSSQLGLIDTLFSRQMLQVVHTADFLMYPLLMRDAMNFAVSPAELLDRVFNIDFLREYQKEPQPSSLRQRLWIDAEWEERSQSVLLMDRFGRVFRPSGDTFELLWKPPIFFDDAVDLELYNGAYIVLRRDRTLVASSLETWLEKLPQPFLFPAPAVDLEFFHSVKGALLISARGEVALIGDAPPDFPSWGNLNFKTNLVADIELDRDERGYYLLDIYGAIHGNHAGGSVTLPISAPAVDPELIPYWPNQNKAIDLEVDPKGRGLLVYTRDGETYSVAAEPYRTTWRSYDSTPDQGAALVVNPSAELFSLNTNGRVIALPADVQ
ncbi:MAG: hypothetical protein GC154_04425 [bacterium]|nr:hypothetical protein [bacterium]